MLRIFFSSLWDAFLGLFGISPEEKLGETETLLKEDDAELKTIKDAREAQYKINQLPAGVALNELRDKWEK